MVTAASVQRDTSPDDTVVAAIRQSIVAVLAVSLAAVGLVSVVFAGTVGMHPVVGVSMRRLVTHSAHLSLLSLTCSCVVESRW